MLTAVTPVLIVNLVVLFSANALSQGLLIFGGHQVQHGFYALVNLNGEQNIPAFYSGALILANAVAMASVSVRLWRQAAKYWLSWCFMATVFLFLAVDEVFGIHERLTAVVDGVMTTPFVFSWVLPGAAFTLAVFVLSLNFLRSLDAPTRRLALVAGGMFVSGALGLELVEGWRWSAAPNPETDPINIIAWSLEEMLELSGMSLMLYAMLRRAEQPSELSRLAEARP